MPRQGGVVAMLHGIVFPRPPKEHEAASQDGDGRWRAGLMSASIMLFVHAGAD